MTHDINDDQMAISNPLHPIYNMAHQAKSAQKTDAATETGIQKGMQTIHSKIIYPMLGEPEHHRVLLTDPKTEHHSKVLDQEP